MIILGREAYETHFNYIECLCNLMRNVTIRYPGSLKKAATPDLDTKKNLIALTKKSLTDERKIVEIDQDYSYASTSWLPIKSYYLLFSVLVTIEYIFKIQKSIYRLGHVTCIDEFTRKLKTGEIIFSEPLLNQVFDQSILKFKVKSGANLSRKTSKSEMYKMALRKISMYKLDDWKQKNNINLRKNSHKLKYQNYVGTFNVSIFDFAYYMRIRANYRDFAFIDGVTTSDTAKYFKYYFGFTSYFLRALEGLQKDLLIMRN